MSALQPHQPEISRQPSKPLQRGRAAAARELRALVERLGGVEHIGTLLVPMPSGRLSIYVNSDNTVRLGGTFTTEHPVLGDVELTVPSRKLSTADEIAELTRWLQASTTNRAGYAELGDARIDLEVRP